MSRWSLSAPCLAVLRSIVSRSHVYDQRIVCLSPISQQPNPVLASCIFRPNSIHVAIPQPQPNPNRRSRKRTRRAHKIPCRIPNFRLTRLPNPLRDNLTNTSAGVVQRRGDRHRSDRRHIACHPRTERPRTRESTAGTHEEHPVSLHVCIFGQQAGAEPADAANGGGGENMPAARVVAIRGPAEEEAEAVAYDPRWDGHELSFDRREAEA